MRDTELAFLPTCELREHIATKQVSPVEVTELYLRRIEALNPQLNAYLTVTADQALAAAREAESAILARKPLGPLHGVPISIKDLEVTKGVRSTMGSLIFKETIPEMDSIVVERVYQAGAIMLGKTNSPEFGLRGTNENRLGDACRNPWNRERTTGGSSGGAGAAVAAGLCSLATGSDGGGSIRIPSSFCGVYGIKPTQGRVPRFGGLGRPVVGQFSQCA
jgi:Asp-tRNA(Asn)/Glu-tRNA(Gln) amidotransferase A subunit family amidase